MFVSIHSFNFGADDRTRTGTELPPRDFKSLASAISPHRLMKKGSCAARTFIWRHHPDLNWGLSFCRALPYHLAMVPYWSGRRDSNPRPSPWQGDALPTEPLPHMCGGNNRARTCDPLLVRQMLSQLSYAPTSRILIYQNSADL